MAHEVNSMMYAGEVPWHGLGVQVPDLVTCVEALGLAGLDWEITTERMWLPDGDDVAEVEGFRAVVRGGDLPTHDELVARLGGGNGITDAKRVLGVVSDTWGPIQNRTIAELGDALMGQGNACCDTAGSLRGGAWVWFLLKLQRTIQVPGDDSPTDAYLLLSCRHDGSMAMRIAFTTVRVVCANTATMALEGAKNYVVIKHTSGIDERIQEVTKALESAGDYFDRYEQVAGKLATARYTDGQLDELAEYLYPAKAKAEPSGLAALQALAAMTPEQRDLQAELNRFEGKIELPELVEALPVAVVEKREALRSSYTSAPGAMPGTAWGALQAVTHATVHGRDWKGSAPRERRFESALFGDSSKLQQRALDKIMEQVQAA